MKIVKSVTASAALALISSVALAEQGTITQIDRTTNSITITQPQDGTVGTSSGSGTVKQFKVQGVSLDALHAGDQVSFIQSGDTITKIERKK